MIESIDEIRIGIDPGTITGFATWHMEDKKYLEIKSMRIDEALTKILNLKNSGSYKIHVTVEDARKRKWFGADSNAKAQGAGSIKRDCTIWEAFLTAHNIPHIMKDPVKGGTKLDRQRFTMMTGYKGVTNEHSRDAAMLVYMAKRIQLPTQGLNFK